MQDYLLQKDKRLAALVIPTLATHRFFWFL